ncbi:MAG: hypothetical protein GY835_22565 [bacterium]|nr:hypothetical protein [bacterium]
MAIQATVNGTTLDNDGTRTIQGEISDTNNLQGQRVIIVPFSIQEDTEGAFATAYQLAQTTFATRNKTVVITPHIGTLDPDGGTYNEMITAVMDDPSHAKTTVSIHLLLVIVAVRTDPLPSAVTGVTGLEELNITDHYTAAGRRSRTVSGSYVKTTGKTAKENYDDGLATILTDYCLTDNDGSWNVTSEMVLVGDHQSDLDGEARRYDFVLESEQRLEAWANTDTAVRDAHISMNSYQHPDWPEELGDPPTVIEVSGAVNLDLTEQPGDLTAQWDATVRDDVETILADEFDSATLKSYSLSSNPDAGSLTFRATYWSTEITVIAYSRITKIDDVPDQAVSGTQDGKHYVQTAPTSPNRTQTVTVSRVGVGIVDITPPTPIPTLPGRTCWYAGLHYTHTAPRTDGEITDLRSQQWSGSWMEIIVENREPPQIPVFTEVAS